MEARTKSVLIDLAPIIHRTDYALSSEFPFSVARLGLRLGLVKITVKESDPEIQGSHLRLP